MQRDYLSSSHSAHLALVGLEMAASLEFVFEGVGNNIFHVLKFPLQILELLVVILDHVLIVKVFTLQLLPLALDRLELFTQLFGQILELLAVLDVLLQLVA